MKYRVFIASILVFLPLFAYAANFAKESLFLSKTPVTDGETVLIHTVVANDSANKFTGDVVFKEGETKIGSVAVTIAPQGANTVSISWKPSAGSHTITAELTSKGTAAESQSATFNINEKPESAESLLASSTPVESSEGIQKNIENFYPAGASFSAPIFNAIDFARIKAAQALDAGIAWAKGKPTGNPPAGGGEVLGEETGGDPGGDLISTAGKIFRTAAVPALSALRYIVGNAGIFYPIFAILFFYVLWRVYKKMRRPNYSSA